MLHIKSINLPGDDKSTSPNRPECRTQVVVVGAGLAGLAAVQRLCEAGIQDVVLLEALDRVGGRVHTVNRSDYLLELGAQWLHGADHNPLYKWLTELNLLNDFEDASSGFKGMFCTPQGEEIDKGLVLKVLQVVCDSKLSLSKKSRVEIITSTGFTNVAEIFKQHLEAKMEQDKQLSGNRALVYSLFEWFLRYEQIENGSDSMSDVSIASYTDWTDCGEGTLLNFRNGYKTLVDWFVKQLPSTKQVIYLNKQVLNVEILKSVTGGSNEWKDTEANRHKSPVLVKYCDTNTNGTNKEQYGTIECDHVVVTVPLGFLKKNQETFFTPELPKIKQDLIESLGFGTVNKIILQFDKPFWRDARGLKLIWGQNEPKTDEFPSWVRDIIAFDVVRRQPNHLIGWIGGRGARQVELESDEHIADVCMKLLRKFQPHWVQTTLLTCICSRWSSNPFFCGSYSFSSMRSYQFNVDKFQEPLFEIAPDETNTDQIDRRRSLGTNIRMPRVMFAGEATAGNLYSTTHGAIISGWREADRLSDRLLGDKNQTNTQSSRKSLTGHLVSLDRLISSSS